MTTSFKVRDEYFRAAQRHLAVCKELQKRIKQLQNKEVGGSSLSQNEELLKHQLLCDLYYLTGYVIECTYCMVIFHYFPDVLEKKDLRAQPDAVGKNNISFKDKVNKASDNETFVIVDSNHRLSSFKNVFTPNLLGVENPIDETLFSKDKCRNLFIQYEAEVRYFKTEKPILKNYMNSERVFALLEAAEKNFNNCSIYHPENKTTNETR